MGRLDKQVVIVTGASAGIGEAAARMLAREGATVVMVARRIERLEAIKKEIERAGGCALAIATDITSAEDRERIVRETLHEFGRIDALVNNAGYPDIVADYEQTFRLLKSLPCDVFLAAHGQFYGMLAKAKQLDQDQKQNPFIDPTGYRQYLEDSEKSFRKMLAAQSQAP